MRRGGGGVGLHGVFSTGATRRVPCPHFGVASSAVLRRHSFLWFAFFSLHQRLGARSTWGLGLCYGRGRCVAVPLCPEASAPGDRLSTTPVQASDMGFWKGLVETPFTLPPLAFTSSRSSRHPAAAVLVRVGHTKPTPKAGPVTDP